MTGRKRKSHQFLNQVIMYKPILFCKLYQRLLKELHIINYINIFVYSRKILSIDSHSGFRSNHATTTLLGVQDYILKLWTKVCNRVIFLDLKRASNTVNHETLINKLASYGIKDNELNWFKLYLCNRP